MRRADHPARLVPLIAILCLVLVAGKVQGFQCLITVNTSISDQSHPDISGDNIVWEDTRDGGIHLYNISTGEESRAAPSAQPQHSPAISGLLVAWQEPNPWHLTNISSRNLLTGSMKDLSMNGKSPAVSGQRIAWVDDAVPGTIALYDEGSGTTQTVVSNGDPSNDHPSLSGDRIVWANGSGFNIYLKDFGTGDEIPLASGSFLGNTNPAISGDKVVWQDDRNVTSDIYLYNLSSGEEKPLASTTTDQTSPAIDGTRVAWVDAAPSEIYLGTDMAGLASPRSVIGSGGVNDLPRISSDRVVWQKYAGGHYDIYLHTINSPEPCPVATFMANATSGMAPLAVQFSDISGDPNTTRWSWEFGDGTTADGQNPVHTYGTDGTYAVSLTVSNMVGRDYTTRTDYIRVGPVPIVSFLANQTYGIAPLPVRFTDTSSGSPASWSWDFGDTGTSTDQNPIHTYGTPGTYTVSLAATNANGTGTMSIPGPIQVLNGVNLRATTDIDGLQVYTAAGREEIVLDTAKMASNTFDPGSPASFSFTPPAASGWQRMTFSSTDGIGFAEDSGGVIRGNYSSCILESRNIIPTTFPTDPGNNLPISYQLQLTAYPVLAEVNATVWEGAMDADDTAFKHTLVTTSTQFTSVMDTAYTVNFVSKNLTGVHSASLNLSVSSAWVQKYGNQNNITVVRLGDDLVNQTLNPASAFTDTTNNLDYFVIPSPRGLSRFALVSATGSSNLLQMGTRLATQLIQSSGGGHSSNDLQGAQSISPPPAKVPVERQPATYYGEGQIDTTPAGIVRDPVIITSADHGASLAIDAGTAAFDSMHVPITLATARAVTTGSIPAMPEGAGIRFTGMAYDIGPDGATFNPPATISFTVPVNQWDTNTQYSIRSYSTKTGSWEEIPTVADPASRVVSGQVSHLCLFGLFAAPAVGPATQAPTIRAPVATPQAQEKPLPRTPMGTFTGLLGWIYAAATLNIPVSFTIALSVLAAIYASTRRAWLSRNRTWITLYLISLTGLLWALFLTASDGPPWESAWILITVTGLNLIVHILRFDRIDLSSRARRGYVEIGRR